MTEEPRLFFTVRLHELEAPHGSLRWAFSSRKPSSAVLEFGWFEMSALPVEVTDTDQSALMLASYPVTTSLNWCPL